MNTNTTILLADDDDGVREALGAVLRSEGFTVSLAADGHEAMLLYERDEPDLVILDLSMPTKNGWVAFEQISTRHPLTPVIIITGRPGQRELAAAARVGALLEKPLDPALLMETVQRLIEEPVGVRLSRLAYAAPGTLYVPSGAHGVPGEGPEQLMLRGMRNQERNGRGTGRGSLGTAHPASVMSP